MAPGVVAARRPVPAMLALCVAIAAGATALWIPLVGQQPLVEPAPFGVVILALLFAAAEATVVHVHVRRHAQSFSLTEAPLILGVVFFSPLTALAARMAASALALVVVRRQRPIKIVFNLVLFAFDSALVTTIVRLGDADPLAPAGWAVAVVATLLGLLAGSAAIAAAIAVTEGTRPGPIGPIVGVLGPLTTVLGTGCGLLAAVTIRSTPDAWLLLAAAAGVVTFAIRAHGDLRERHRRLERAYAFTTDAVASIEEGRDRTAILERACDVLRAEWAEVAVPGDQGAGALVVTNCGGTLRIVQGAGAAAVLRQRRAVLASRPSAIVDGGDGDGFRTAVLAAIPGEDGQTGTFLVAERLGDVDRFAEADRHLLEALARQTALVVRNRALLDRLRDEITERHHLALHDPLTQLPNRVLLASELERALVERGDDEVVAVLLVDLDRFKEVNDTLGHQQGDRLLQDVARRIVLSVPAAATVARLGGDEFAVLLPPGLVDGVGGAEAIGRRLLAGLETPFELAEMLVDVGASVGVAACPGHAEEGSALLQRADVAMYAAKAVGCGVAVYDPSDDRTSRQRLGLVAELRTAIERRELHVEFQPIVDVASGNPVGAEALCRWYRPKGGRVPPDEFVPTAEASGLIGPLTRLVLDLSLMHLRRWRDGGAQMGVSVNLSARNLVDGDLPDAVASLLARHGVPPSALTLEVTESSILSEPARVAGVVNRLAAMGVRLSIDDFGTGYSSLSKLQELPVQEVKIDRSFVRDLPHRREHRAIVCAVTELAAALDLSVTAEGVEDGPTLQLLGGIGCNRAQGFHVARPLSPAAFDEWLAHRFDEQQLLDRLLSDAGVVPADAAH